MTRRAALVLLALAMVAVVAAPGQALADGPARWGKPALTVRVADSAAWAATDVPAALAQWSPVMPMTLTDDPTADVTLMVGQDAPLRGANTERSEDSGAITACQVLVDPDHAGTDLTYVLTHELGHCLGLRHVYGDELSVMSTGDLATNQSLTVTPGDLARVRAMYR